MKKLGFIHPSLITFVCLMTAPAFGASSYHLVGWVNTVVPGGGKLLLGEPLAALQQAALETGSFMWGYGISKRTPLTLDGVPEDYPIAEVGTVRTTRTDRICTSYNPTTKKCTKFATKTSTSSSSVYNGTPMDLTRSSLSLLLQEFGIKYHMVNVFNSYREAAHAENPDEDSGIDQRSTGDLFLDPFRAENLLNPWVYIPILLSAGYIAYDYSTLVKGGLPAQQPLTGMTNLTIALNQIGTYPVGSAAPEEMFYRGFIQNEAYHAVPSPYFSIAMSSLAFAFSHGSELRVSAGLTGAYLGFLSYRYRGNLGASIALHFWSVFLLGVEAYALSIKSQHIIPPQTAAITLSF